MTWSDFYAAPSDFTSGVVREILTGDSILGVFVFPIWTGQCPWNIFIYLGPVVSLYKIYVLQVGLKTMVTWTYCCWKYFSNNLIRNNELPLNMGPLQELSITISIYARGPAAHTPYPEVGYIRGHLSTGVTVLGNPEPRRMYKAHNAIYKSSQKVRDRELSPLHGMNNKSKHMYYT